MRLCVFSTFLSISSLTIKVISRSIAARIVPPSERVLLLYGEDCLVSEHGQVFQFLRGYPAECRHFTLDINKAEGLTVYDDWQKNDEDILLDPSQIPCRQMRLYSSSREVFDNKVCRFRYGHIENILLLFQREFKPLSKFGQIRTESKLDLHDRGLRIPQKEQDFRIPRKVHPAINGFEGDLDDVIQRVVIQDCSVYLEDPLREDCIRRLLTVGFEYPFYRVDSGCLPRQDFDRFCFNSPSGPLSQRSEKWELACLQAEHVRIFRYCRGRVA